ncbi:MAG: polymer-forming cytoskeletal protein [Sphingomonas sp.]
MGIFGRKARRARAPGPVPLWHPPGDGKRGMVSVLSPDVLIAGDIGAAADLHIDGHVEGDVCCRTLTQGAGSEIVGTVIAETARLGGTIRGAVRVRQLTVERSARINGDIEYENITIEDGGHIDGRLNYMRVVESPAVDGVDVQGAAPISLAES